MRTFLVVLSLAILVGLAQPALGLPLDLSISFTLDHVSGSNTCLDGAEVTLFATFAKPSAGVVFARRQRRPTSVGLRTVLGR